MSYTSRPPYSEQEARIRLVSSPFFQRRAVMMSLAIFAFTLVLAVVLLFGSINALLRFPNVATFAIFTLILSVLLGGYVIIVGWRLLSYTGKEYIFELSEDEARMKVVDKRTQRKEIARVLYQDIDYVEFFTPRDKSALVFHSIFGQLIEVPLWALTGDASSVLNFLREKQVSVVRF
jgi:hypothetical protein